MPVLTPDMLQGLQQSFAQQQQALLPQQDPGLLARQRELMSQAYPDDPRVETAQSGPYGDAGLLGAKEQMIEARRELLSSQQLGDGGLQSFVMQIMDQAGSSRDNLGATIDDAKRKRLSDAIAKGEVNPANEEEAIKWLNAPLSNATKLTAQMRTKIQEELLAHEEIVRQTGELQAAFNPEFSKYVGKGKAFAQRARDKLGLLPDDQSAFLTEYTLYTQQVDRLFNQYRKSITGAAASVKELEMLKKSMLNNDLSPVQHKAVLDAMANAAQFDVKIKQRLLDEGLSFNNKARIAEIKTELIKENAAYSPDVVHAQLKSILEPSKARMGSAQVQTLEEALAIAEAEGR